MTDWGDAFGARAIFICDVHVMVSYEDICTLHHSSFYLSNSLERLIIQVIVGYSQNTAMLPAVACIRLKQPVASASSQCCRNFSVSSRRAGAAEVNRLGVVGGGQMVYTCSIACLLYAEYFANSDGKGLGIALVAAMKAKVQVTIVDTSQDSIDKGLKFAGIHAMPT